MAGGAAGGAAGASAAAAAAAIARATRASGVIVEVDEASFLAILHKIERPLVVCAEAGFFTTSFRYLVSYRGLAFHTKTSRALTLPGSAETVLAEKIWTP